ncbi:MAG: respiratory nitrate reductase subunit gamma, partial [Candidatus Marinimicrobia bacterium]|nr:respiratory nitrate reductase subunit gamma [Candidatus Neomarinimicrobiota bacterium]
MLDNLFAMLENLFAIFNDFFFIGLPYISIFLLFGGTLYRLFFGFKGTFRKMDRTARGDFLWTTRSTGFFGRASIGPAALCLHWGIITLFVTHLVGVVGGVLSLIAWVDFFRWVGMFGGILLLFGLVWAFVRRIVIPQVKAMSKAEDYIVLIFLILIAFFGLYQSAIKLVFGVTYSVAPWLWSVVKLQPDPSLMQAVPLVNKLH